MIAQYTLHFVTSLMLCLFHNNSRIRADSSLSRLQSFAMVLPRYLKVVPSIGSSVFINFYICPVGFCHVGLCLEKLQAPDTLCIASHWMGNESHKNKESILLHNTAVAPGQAHSQFSLFTD